MISHGIRSAWTIRRRKRRRFRDFAAIVCGARTARSDPATSHSASVPSVRIDGRRRRSVRTPSTCRGGAPGRAAVPRPTSDAERSRLRPGRDPSQRSDAGTSTKLSFDERAQAGLPTSVPTPLRFRCRTRPPRISTEAVASSTRFGTEARMVPRLGSTPTWMPLLRPPDLDRTFRSHTVRDPKARRWPSTYSRRFRCSRRASRGSPFAREHVGRTRMRWMDSTSDPYACEVVRKSRHATTASAMVSRAAGTKRPAEA